MSSLHNSRLQGSIGSHVRIRCARWFPFLFAGGLRSSVLVTVPLADLLFVVALGGASCRKYHSQVPECGCAGFEDSSWKRKEERERRDQHRKHESRQKEQGGRDGRDAVEIFPSDSHSVHFATKETKSWLGSRALVCPSAIVSSQGRADGRRQPREVLGSPQSEGQVHRDPETRTQDRWHAP